MSEPKRPAVPRAPLAGRLLLALALAAPGCDPAADDGWAERGEGIEYRLVGRTVRAVRQDTGGMILDLDDGSLAEIRADKGLRMRVRGGPGSPSGRK